MRASTGASLWLFWGCTCISVLCSSLACSSEKPGAEALAGAPQGVSGAATTPLGGTAGRAPMGSAGQGAAVAGAAAGMGSGGTSGGSAGTPSSGASTSAGAFSLGGGAPGGSSGNDAADSGGAGAGAGGAGAGGASNGASGATSSSAGSSGAGVCVATTAVANMKIGWNLGNSLDSADASKPDTTVETAWGNPPVTPALIDAVAKAGFGVVRIPVTWIGRFGPAPDYTISPTYVARVAEVVDYVLDAGLYAIINLHHDGAQGLAGEWISLVNASGQVDPAHDARVIAQFEKIWAQVADRFKNYGERLIFESMNEIKVGYDAPLPAYLEQVNRLNAAFVSTVRATGGNNPSRCLVVPGYNTNIDHTLAGFVAPPDPSPGKLILSAHFYDPWSYAGAGMTHAWGAGAPGVDTWGQEDWVRSVVMKLKAAYIDKGLPVIWGEYGAVNQTGYENYRRYYMEYVTKATHDAGIVPIYWDNGFDGSGEEAFGLMDRASNGVLHPDVLEAMMRAVTSSYELADIEKP